VTESTVRLSLDAIRELGENALLANGFSAAQASAIAKTVTAAERDHCVSHGLFRIPFYVGALKNPDTNPRAEPVVSETESSVIHVDAKRGFCPYALEIGLPVLINKAKQRGIAALAIHQTYNIAALWPEMEVLANEHLVGMAFTASNACVAPAGGISPVFGTNPMAFAWPRPGKFPLVFDQASSACARGEIQLHKRRGESLPEGWAIDSAGQPTTDPDAALAGAQLPFGGYKGSAIALMVELLAGALIGDLISLESKAQDVHKTGAPFGGEFLIAIDPGHCLAGSNAEQQAARAETLFNAILEQDGTRLPSDRRFSVRESSVRDGVDVATTLIDTIKGMSE